MKRFVRYFLVPMAILLGHTLIYSAGEYECVEYSQHSDESFFNMPVRSCCTNLSYGETMTAFQLDSKNLNTGVRHQNSVGHVTSANQFRKLNTNTVTGNALGILKCGKLLNSYKLYDYLNVFSYHISGVRATVDRLFTLGSVRC
jgi:hypothetical protein